MAEVIAEGLVLIKARQDVERTMREARAAFERGMRDMDRKEASMVLDADLAPLQKKLKDAERKVEQYKKKLSEDAEMGLDTRKAERNLRDWERRLARSRKARDEVNLSTEKARRQLAALQKIEDNRAELRRKYNESARKAEERLANAVIKHQEDVAKAAQKAADERAKAAKKAADAEIKEAERRVRKEEQLRLAAWKEDRKRTARKMVADQRAADAAQLHREKEIAAIPKINRQYAELERRIQRLNRERTKLSRDPQSRNVVNLQIEEAVAEMEELKRRLTAIGRTPPVEVVIHPGREFGTRMRREVLAARNDRGTAAAALAFGTVIGSQVTRGFLRSARNIPSGIAAMFSRLGHGIANLTVRIGPFTATIRQVLIGLALLGPILVNLVGSMGSLVSVLGSATLGLGALSVGFLGGAIPAAVGMGFVIKDVAQEFTAAKKATKAYDDAVLKHGKGSDQAAKKLKELRNVMGGVSETTAKQFRDGQKLGKTWDKLTKPAHASVWKVIGNGMEAAAKIMPMFAKNTNEAMDTAEKGTSKWMKALSDPAGQRVLDTMMDNFNKSLGPLMSGLGNVAGYFGKIGAEASRYLPGLSKTFESWAKRLNESADGSEAFRSRIRNVVQSAKDVGNLFLAAGRYIKTFFSIGVGSGQSFARVMTQNFNKWNAFLQTTEGRRGLREFFDESVAGARALWNALSPLIGAFIRWANLLSPVVTGFLKGAAAVGEFVAGILRLTALHGPISALATTLGVLWAIGKISAATRAVGAFTKALFGMSAANAAVTATAKTSTAATAAAAAAAARAASVGRGAPGTPTSGRPARGIVRSAPSVAATTAAAAAAGAGAARATGAIGKLSKAGGIASKVMKGLGLATLGISSPLAGAAIAAGAVGFGIYKLATRTKQYEKDQKGAAAATRDFVAISRDLGPVQNQLAQEYLNSRSAALQVRDAEKEVARLRRDGKVNTDEYKQAMLNLHQAEMNRVTTLEQRRAVERDTKRGMDALTKSAQRALEQTNRYVAGLGKRSNTKSLFKSESENAREAGVSLSKYLKSADHLAGNQKKRILEYAGALKLQEQAQYRVRRAQELSFLATLNHQRATKGLSSIAANAAGHFARLKRAQGGAQIAKKIAVQFTDGGDAARVARSASKALRGGVPKRVVTNIVTNTKNADTAIARLRGKLAGIAAKEASVKIGASDKASATIGRIVARVNGIKDKTARIKARDEAIPTIARIISKISGVKDKEARMIARDLVSGPARAAAAALAALRDRQVTITERRVIATIYTSKGRQQRPTASGKRAGAGGYNALIGEGGGPEWRMNTKSGMVYKTTGPEAVRLGTQDAIIPTEPRYRSRGREIFKEIAKDLGLAAFDKGKSGRRGGGRRPAAPARKKDTNLFGEFGSKGAFNPEAKVLRPPTFKSRGKKASKFKAASRGWASYIENLQLQQSYWEREVSIRESQVKEPEDMVIETGTRDVKDPATGEVTKVPIYGPNPEIEKSYKPSLKAVLDAMLMLMQVVRQLVAMIPQAIAANAQEGAYHGQEKKKLDREIRKEQRRKPARGKSDEKRERIAKLKDRRDRHAQAEEELAADRKQLGLDRTDAGFTIREVDIARGKMQTEYDTAQGEAVGEALEKTKEGITNAIGGGAAGGGGGTSDPGNPSEPPLSYGDQAMIRDTERANLLREHGGNAYSTSPGSAGALGMPGGGMQQNPAMRGDGGTYSGSGVTRSMAAGGFSAFGGGGGYSGSGVSNAAPGGGDKTVIINNHYQTQPEDPHTWSQGMAFEANSAF